jgi:hypothetical protein
MAQLPFQAVVDGLVICVVQASACNPVPNCGAHGTLSANCGCTCAAGWTTNTNQDLAHYYYCTVQSSSGSTSTSGSAQSESSPCLHRCHTLFSTP